MSLLEVIKMTTEDNKRSIESQLDCKATAALNNQIADELEAEDKPLSEVLEDEEEEETE
jgi:hypothetical protein